MDWVEGGVQDTGPGGLFLLRKSKALILLKWFRRYSLSLMKGGMKLPTEDRVRIMEIVEKTLEGKVPLPLVDRLIGLLHQKTRDANADAKMYQLGLTALLQSERDEATKRMVALLKKGEPNKDSIKGRKK